MRLDQFVAQWLEGISRSFAQRAIQNHSIQVNDCSAKPSYKVKPQDRITLMLPYPPLPPAQPEDIPLTILYEDEALLVINKPAGLVCHPTPSHRTGTLYHRLLYAAQSWSSPSTSEPHLVHRLDAQTSGLLLVAKTKAAVYPLLQQFTERTIQRTYDAIVWGNTTTDQGTLTGPIGPAPNDEKRWAVVEDGKPSTTHFEVLERYGIATHIRCKLETGRTHQIRVHLSHLGHPLVGDMLYGGSSPATDLQQELSKTKEMLECMTRQALHARTLRFVHPTTQEAMQVESPWPEDFQKLHLLLQSFKPERNQKSTVHSSSIG